MRRRKRGAGDGGALRADARRATTQNLGDGVEIRMRDNGTGIPPDVQDKMFNPFFTTKPAGEGTGLGLSLSHDIVVKQHGGTIEVETEPGEFTEFTIVLPRERSLARQIGRRRSEPAHPRGRRRARRRDAVPPAVPPRSQGRALRDGFRAVGAEALRPHRRRRAA